MVDIEWDGQRATGFRPAGLEEGRGFAIALSHSLVRVEAFFVGDPFSGPVLRLIGKQIGQDPDPWFDLLEAGNREGISTSIAVNDALVANLAELPTDDWRRLEIDCHRRIPRSTGGSGLHEALVGVGSHCFALALTGLDAEISTAADPESLPEGARTTIQVNRYERNPVNRTRCIKHYGAVCWVCDLDFATTYGAIGQGYIEVHHRIPVSQMGTDYRVDPVRDLIPLCSNCHSMVHRRNPPYSPHELRLLIGKGTKDPLPPLP